MRSGSRKIHCLIGSVLAVYVFSGACAQEAAVPVIDGDLVEVRSLSKLPQTLAETLGSRHSDKDQIADLERESRVNIPRWVNRWFLLGGLSDSHALVAIEGPSAYPLPRNGIRAEYYALVNGAWVLIREWMLASRPHTLSELALLVKSPETQTLTELWQKKIADKDRERSMARSDPRRWHGRTPFREIDINDEEVREIEVVVRGVSPGAIVNISGVAKGCPCEDGPSCTAQVWTVIYQPSKTSSLELSEVNSHWVVGPVQQWYLDSDQLERTKFTSFSAYTAAHLALDERYPTCAKDPASPRS